MSLEQRVQGDVTILTPKGMLIGGRETEEFQNKVIELNAAGNGRLLINLGKTTFMSSMGLTVLFIAQAKYVTRGAKVKLCCVDRKLKQVFIMVRLALIYGDDIHDTEEEALAAFRAMAGAGGR